MAAEGFHEQYEALTPETRDMHRAIHSLMEELEAVDWYQQRVDAAGNSELGAILAHNRDDEKEHAAMLLEWIRRRDTVFDTQLRKYLFTAGSILEKETAGKSSSPSNAIPTPPAIGSLKGDN